MPTFRKLCQSRCGGYAKHSEAPCGSHRCKNWLLITLDTTSQHGPTPSVSFNGRKSKVASSRGSLTPSRNLGPKWLPVLQCQTKSPYDAPVKQCETANNIIELR